MKFATYNDVSFIDLRQELYQQGLIQFFSDGILSAEGYLLWV